MELLKGKFEEFWIITNILSYSKNPSTVLSFYLYARRVVCLTCGVNEDELLDNVGVSFAQINDIFVHIYVEKASSKMRLVRGFDSESRASTVLSSIMIDWLTNKSSNGPKKEVKAKDDLKLVNKRKLDKKKTSKSVTNMRTKVTKSPLKTPKNNISVKAAEKNNLKKLNEEKKYLQDMQYETDVKIEKLRRINNDLIHEHNNMFDKGKSLYNAFFGLYYTVKLEASKKFAKLPVTEAEVEEIKEFLNFSKIKEIEGEIEVENPMENLVNKSRKIN